MVDLLGDGLRETQIAQERLKRQFSWERREGVCGLPGATAGLEALLTEVE